jgi:Flp pilus assembly pilin Flp
MPPRLLPVVRQLVSSQGGAEAIEYTFLIALLSFAAIGGMTNAGQIIRNGLGIAASVVP